MGRKSVQGRTIDKELDREILKIKDNGMSYRKASEKYVKRMREMRWRLLGLMEKKHK